MGPWGVQIVLTCKYSEGEEVSFGQTQVNMLLESRSSLRPLRQMKPCLRIVCNYIQLFTVQNQNKATLSRLQYKRNFSEFNVHGSVHRRNILIYVQQDATLHSLFYLETVLHVSGGTTTHHQKSEQMYLQHLVFVTPLLLSAVIAADKSNFVTNIRCCRYSCLLS